MLEDEFKDFGELNIPVSEKREEVKKENGEKVKMEKGEIKRKIGNRNKAVKNVKPVLVDVNNVAEMTDKIVQDMKEDVKDNQAHCE